MLILNLLMNCTDGPSKITAPETAKNFSARLRERHAGSKTASMPEHVSRSHPKAIVAAVFTVFPATLQSLYIFRKALIFLFEGDDDGLVDFLNHIVIFRSGPATYFPYPVRLLSSYFRLLA